MWPTSGWYCTPAYRRTGFSNAAIGVPALAAVTVKPGGAAATESPWLIQTFCWVGSPDSSVPSGSVTVSAVPPYSRRPVRSTRPPSAAAMAWKP